MKNKNLIFLISAYVVLFTGCANSLNQSTSENYSQICAEAENNGNMSVATEACYKAYINTEWGNLSPELKSEKLYNFGRILRKAGRYKDSKEALIKALSEEEKITGKNSKKSGRRMTELAATYYHLNQIDRGVILIDRIIPISDMYSSAEKHFISALLHIYSNKIVVTQEKKSDMYKLKMKQLGYPSEFFTKMGR